MNDYHLWHNEIHISHPKELKPVFEQFLHDFDTIIEIGTYAGGLTVWMADVCKAHIITYDIIDPASRPKGVGTDKIHAWFDDRDIEFNLGSCFRLEDKIGKQIEQGGRCLVLCDGGNKIKEFTIFSKFLKPNDVIMAHDYEETGAEFRESAHALGWPHKPEIRFQDVRPSVDMYKLRPYEYYHELKKLFWGAWIK